MTSIRKIQFKHDRLIEQQIFDRLPAPVRAAIANADASVRPSVVRDTLLRGVPESRIIETLNKRSPKP